MFDFIDKELKLNIVTPLNLPFELIKKFENSLISTLYYGNEGNYDCTKKFIENLNEETNKIFIIYHKILKKFVKVKLEFVSYCSDYDQLLIDTNFKKSNSKFFCIKDKISKIDILDLTENKFEKRSLKELIDEYEKSKIDWEEKKNIFQKNDFKFIKKFKIVKNVENYFYKGNFYYNMCKLTPFVNFKNFDIFVDSLMDFTHGWLNCIVKPLLIFIFSKLTESEIKIIEENFIKINNIIFKNNPELKCLTDIKFNFNDYMFEEWISISYQIPYLFRSSNYKILIDKISKCSCFFLRKLFNYEKNFLKNNYKNLIDYSISFFENTKKDNPFMQHRYF
jgi:hypothetical protein